MKDPMLKGPTPCTFPGGLEDLFIASALDTSDEHNLFGGSLECRTGISAAALPLPSTAAMDHRYSLSRNPDSEYIICSDLCSSYLCSSYRSRFPPNCSLVGDMAPPVLADFAGDSIALEEGTVFTWSDGLMYTLDFEDGIFVCLGPSKRPGFFDQSELDRHDGHGDDDDDDDDDDDKGGDKDQDTTSAGDDKDKGNVLPAAKRTTLFNRQTDS